MALHLLLGHVSLVGALVLASPPRAIEKDAGFGSVQARADAPGDATVLPADAVLLLLDPLVRFERVVDEAELHVTPAEEQGFKAALSAAARRAFETVAIRPQPEDAGEQWAKSIAGAEALSSRLARGQVTDDARPWLTDLEKTRQHTFILAQYFKVKEGQRGSWDPYSGAIRSSTTGAELHAALISCASGDVLWRNAIVIRNRPRPDDRRFQDALARFFATLGARRQQKRR
jgi:hypothetical protein